MQENNISQGFQMTPTLTERIDQEIEKRAIAKGMELVRHTGTCPREVTNPGLYYGCKSGANLLKEPLIKAIEALEEAEHALYRIWNLNEGFEEDFIKNAELISYESMNEVKKQIADLRQMLGLED